MKRILVYYHPTHKEKAESIFRDLIQNEFYSWENNGGNPPTQLIRLEKNCNKFTALLTNDIIIYCIPVFKPESAIGYKWTEVFVDSKIDLDIYNEIIKPSAWYGSEGKIIIFQGD